MYIKITPRQFVEFIGVASLIGSLIFVALELRQSNRIAITAAESDIRSAVRENRSLVAENSELAAIIAKSSNSDAELSPVEVLQLENYSQARFNIFTQVNAAYTNGLLTDYSLEIYKKSISDAIRNSPYDAENYYQTVRYYDLNLTNSVLWNHLVSELEILGYEF